MGWAWRVVGCGLGVQWEKSSFLVCGRRQTNGPWDTTGSQMSYPPYFELSRGPEGRHRTLLPLSDDSKFRPHGSGRTRGDRGLPTRRLRAQIGEYIPQYDWNRSGSRHALQILPHLSPRRVCEDALHVPVLLPGVCGISARTTRRSYPLRC